MNYIDTHLQWMTGEGLEVLKFEDVEPVTHGNDLPEELQLWFDLAVTNRVRPFQPLGYVGWEGYWLDDESDEDMPWRIPDYVYAEEERRNLLFPKQPVGLHTSTNNSSRLKRLETELGGSTPTT